LSTGQIGQTGEFQHVSDDNTLTERIEAVANAEAEDDQLVTVAIPPGEPIETMRERVQEEHAEAEYLNEREEVRKPLKQALEETRRILRDYEETPDHGLVVYVGEVGGDFVTEVFDDLPDPVGGTTFRYANEFDVTPLGPSTSGTNTYGLVVVARESAALGRYDGETIEHVDTVESQVPSKQAAEGGDESRFEGRSQERMEEFFERVGDAVAREFAESPPVDSNPAGSSVSEPGVAGLLVGGSEVVAERFHEGDHLPEPLSGAVSGPFDVEYASESGLRQLVDAAEATDALDVTEARDALERFFDALGDDDRAATGGREEVDEALEYGAVETLLLAESLPAEEVQTLRARAEEKEAGCVVVPEDLDRAERLEEAFDGVGALLRFPVE
jgi:peptide chain release factor 1